MSDVRVSTEPLPDFLTDQYGAEIGKLRCTRKADRAEMVAVLTRLAEHFGGKIEAEPAPLNEQHGISVHIRLNDAYVFIDLDGACRLSRDKDGAIYLGHWNIERKSPRKYDRYFGSLVGSINEFHWQKATLCVRGFGYFVLKLAIALGSIKDGTAFQQEAA